MPAETSIVVAPKRTDLANPMLEFYFDYWHRVRGDRPMPSRADIRAADLKPWLGHLILAEALPGYEDFRFRLIGTRVTDYFLAEATGSTIREAYGNAGLPKAYIDGVVQLHRAVCERKTLVRVKGPYGEWKGQFYPEFDVLYFPLSEDGETARMVMSVFSFDDQRLRTLRHRTAAHAAPAA